MIFLNFYNCAFYIFRHKEFRYITILWDSIQLYISLAGDDNPLVHPGDLERLVTHHPVKINPQGITAFKLLLKKSMNVNCFV